MGCWVCQWHEVLSQHCLPTNAAALNTSLIWGTKGGKQSNSPIVRIPIALVTASVVTALTPTGPWHYPVINCVYHAQPHHPRTRAPTHHFLIPTWSSYPQHSDKLFSPWVSAKGPPGSPYPTWRCSAPQSHSHTQTLLLLSTYLHLKEPYCSHSLMSRLHPSTISKKGGPLQAHSQLEKCLTPSWSSVSSY